MKIYFTLLIALFVLSTSAQESLNCSLLYQWQDDELPGSAIFDNTYNEIWGYSAEGREYAIIGSTMGTHIFDITEIGNAEEIHFFEGEVTGPNIIHRDFHDYSGYLYVVCDEGSSSLQVIDMNGLPETATMVYDSSEILIRSHNIFIDESNAMMYVCGGEDQLRLVSLENPEAPVEVLDCNDDIPEWQTVGYLHDIYVKDGIAYCNNGSGLFIVDFSDLTNVQVLGSLTDYSESGYNHSGWLHESGQYYALADETHGMRIKLLDVSDPTDITEVSLFGSGINENSIAHNLIFEGDILHVSYYYDGYYAFDISDPENPETIAFYDTSEIAHGTSYKGAWGVYPLLSSGKILVSDMQEGLFVLGLETPNSIEELQSGNKGIYPNPAEAGSSIQIQTIPNSHGSTTFALLNTMGNEVHSGQIKNGSTE
ncbi:MAG: choice-of-anchor B domain-containing protein, partial [Flavobacteriales bacterium]